MTTLRERLRSFYLGSEPPARRFRLALLWVDVFIIAFFVVSTSIGDAPWVRATDAVVVVVLILDWSARLTVARSKLRYLLEPVTIADLIVIGTLLAQPWMQDFAFLRVMRALRLLRSYQMLRELRARYAFFRRNEAVIESVVNLAVFIFLVTALVYVLQVGRNPAIQTYVDALYFTVTTLTTTGFGDVTLMGTSGRLLAVVIMVFGVALFLRLVQAIFRPPKVRSPCPACGLTLHDPDAVHCKHCGLVLNIETEGE